MGSKSCEKIHKGFTDKNIFFAWSTHAKSGDVSWSFMEHNFLRIYETYMYKQNKK